MSIDAKFIQTLKPDDPLLLRMDDAITAFGSKFGPDEMLAQFGLWMLCIVEKLGVGETVITQPRLGVVTVTIDRSAKSGG